MKFGAFMMPNNPPERGIGAGHRHNLDYRLSRPHRL